MCLTDELITNTNSNKVNTLIRKCDLTSSNYGNYANRLQRRKILFQILLPYYSVIGVLNGIFPKHFTNIGEEKITILSFWGIFISITFLVISMQIALARYPERISEATDRLNKLKILKGELQKCSNNEDKIDEMWCDYNKIVSEGIIIHRRFFYATCRATDRKQKISTDGTKWYQHLQDSETNKHFSFSERTGILFTNALEILAFILIFLLPLIVYYIVLFVI